MLTRRGFFAATALALFACAGRRGALDTLPRAAPLATEPLVDLAVAAGLVWLVDLRPEPWFSSDALRRVVCEVVPQERFERFAQKNGVELRQARRVVVSGYGDGTLYLAQVPFDATRVRAAFIERLVTVDGEAEDVGEAADRRPFETVRRLRGRRAGARVELAMIGPGVLALELGSGRRVRAAIARAEGRLERVAPALRSAPLDEACALLGDAPLRAFFPGPFEGELAQGLSGLLGATRAVALGVTPRTGEGGVELEVRALLMGAWTRDREAQEHVQNAIDRLRASAHGALLGLDRLVAGPTLEATRGNVLALATLDGALFARGLRLATQGTRDELLGAW